MIIRLGAVSPAFLPGTVVVIRSWFDRLTTNGSRPPKSMSDPFALSLSKGEERIGSAPPGEWVRQ